MLMLTGLLLSAAWALSPLPGVLAVSEREDY